MTDVRWPGSFSPRALLYLRKLTRVRRFRCELAFRRNRWCNVVYTEIWLLYLVYFMWWVKLTSLFDVRFLYMYRSMLENLNLILHTILALKAEVVNKYVHLLFPLHLVDRVIFYLLSLRLGLFTSSSPDTWGREGTRGEGWGEVRGGEAAQRSVSGRRPVLLHDKQTGHKRICTCLSSAVSVIVSTSSLSLQTTPRESKCLCPARRHQRTDSTVSDGGAWTRPLFCCDILTFMYLPLRSERPKLLCLCTERYTCSVISQRRC